MHIHDSEPWTDTHPSAAPQADVQATSAQSVTCTPANIGANGIPASFKVDASQVSLPDGATLFVSIASPDISETNTVLAFSQLAGSAADAEVANAALAADGATDVLESGKTYQVTCAGAVLSADAVELAYLTESSTEFTFSP